MKRYPCRGALAIFIYCILVLMLTAAVYLLVLVFRGEAILDRSLLGIFISVLISIGLIAAAAVHLVGVFRKTIAFSETDLSVKSDVETTGTILPVRSAELLLSKIKTR